MFFFLYLFFTFFSFDVIELTFYQEANQAWSMHSCKYFSGVISHLWLFTSRLWRRSMNNNAIYFIQDLENTGKKRIKFLIPKSWRTEKVIGEKYRSGPIALLSSEKQIVTQGSWPMYPHFIWVLVSQDLLSHINVSMVSFLQSLLLLFYFCVFFSQLSELVWKLAEEISLQSASKRFRSFGPPANGNKSNSKKSRFRPNRNLTGTIYH